ncbi:MAG: hypothetical protein ACRBM6_03690 [Geminicoccales bacterium]
MNSKLILEEEEHSMSPIARLIAAAAFLVSLSSQALADQIDGDWCFPGDGRILTIQGEAIVTANGTNTKGDYARHTFRYVVPEQDPGAGSEINMRQLNDETMVLRNPDGSEETWKRCNLQTS